MTRPTQKRRERFFVEQAAKLLGKPWILENDREHPDFIVTEGDRRFGLEVCEIFIGPQDHAGSAMKRTESGVHRQLEELRRQYEVITPTTLRVPIVGRLSPENMASIVPALVAEDSASKPIGHHLVIDRGNGVRLHVTKAFRPEWFSVNHRVGWVDRNPLPMIIDAISTTRTTRDSPASTKTGDFGSRTSSRSMTLPNCGTGSASRSTRLNREPPTRDPRSPASRACSNGSISMPAPAAFGAAARLVLVPRSPGAGAVLYAALSGQALRLALTQSFDSLTNGSHRGCDDARESCRERQT
jgi:hypothetical protein